MLNYDVFFIFLDINVLEIRLQYQIRMLVRNRNILGTSGTEHTGGTSGGSDSHTTLVNCANFAEALPESSHPPDFESMNC